MMNNKYKYAVFVFSGILANITFASTITWNYSLTDLDNPNNDGYSNELAQGPAVNFINDTELVYAYNMHGGTIDFDGISFEGIDSVSLQEDTGNIGANGNIAGYAVFGASNTIQKTGFNNNATWELKNLTVGYEYIVQVLIYDGRNVVNGREVKFDQDDPQQYAFGTYQNSSTGFYNQGLIATGTFIADESFQTFDVSSVNGHPVNAMALFTTGSIPEPAAYTIILSLGIFIFIRVFKHRKIA